MFLIEVIKAFRKAKLSYAVAGGCAVSLHAAARGCCKAQDDHQEDLRSSSPDSEHSLTDQNEESVRAPSRFGRGAGFGKAAMKPIQFFSDDYLKEARKASPTQIAKFLDDFRKLQTQSPQPKERDPSKLISLRLPLRILLRLKARAKAEQIPYQTLLKKILEDNLP